ncbi:hypothetical protein FRC06_008356, partial [Ceratobasidium sp. 370]
MSLSQTSNASRGTSKISSFKRDWDGEPPVPPSSQETSDTAGNGPSGTATSSSSGGATKPSGTKRFAAIMAALHAGLDNKASGTMSTASPVSVSQPSTTTSSSTAAWVDSVTSSSISSSAPSTTTKRSHEDDTEQSSKKRRGSREKDPSGVQMSLTLTNQNTMENRPAGVIKDNL